MTTPAIIDFQRRRLASIEAAWEADGRLDEGEISFLIRISNRYFAESAPDVLDALKDVVRIADRKTVEFDRARAAIAKALAEPVPVSATTEG